MKKEFNIIDRYVERVTECFLRSECAKFIEYFFLKSVDYQKTK